MKIQKKLFNTVFRKLSDDELQKEELLIRTNKEGREITIYFNGISKLTSLMDNTGRKIYTPQKESVDCEQLERLKLVDTKAGVEVPFIKEGNLQSYSFKMDDDEKERRFVLVLDTQKISLDDEAVSQPKSEIQAASPKHHNADKTVIDLDAPLHGD